MAKIIRRPQQSRPMQPIAGESMKAGVYLRVSTDEQTSANQIPDVERLCAARGWTITHRYEETISGTAKVRPQLAQMMDDAHRGAFQNVVVWALDRLGRGGIAEMATIIAKLDAAGVGLVSVRESWCDTSGPMRSLLIAITAWHAEQERTRLSERTRAGLARARSQGRIGGRPKRSVDVSKVRALRSEGRSWRSIAVALKCPARTLRDAVQRAES